MTKNLIGLKGIEFVEFSTVEMQSLDNLFKDFGFTCLQTHKDKNISLYRQNQINFLLNSERGSFGYRFSEKHGPSISAMAWRFQDAKKAFDLAVQRGARPCLKNDYDLPAVYGIGESLIYFVDQEIMNKDYENLGFIRRQDVKMQPSKGFECIDHLTNNVYKGTMKDWADFYKNIFEFTEVRYFDIRGEKTGLTSYALRSADGSFCIPINEADEKKSQINEYLEQYHGPGIQHLAFLTNDILKSLKALEGSKIEMLDIKPDYYEMAFKRTPNVREDKKEIQKRHVLVDGDEEGYLLQIFTKNIIGPIFVEIIQRNNHLSFGEGNFQALFDSIERDQMKRGVFDV